MMPIHGPLDQDPHSPDDIQFQVDPSPEVKNEAEIKNDNDNVTPIVIKENNTVVSALVEELGKRGKLPVVNGRTFEDFSSSAEYIKAYQKVNPKESMFEGVVEHMGYDFEKQSDDPHSNITPEHYTKNGKSYLAFKVTYDVVLKDSSESVKFSQKIYTDQCETKNITLPPGFEGARSHNTRTKVRFDIKKELKRLKSSDEPNKAETKKELLKQLRELDAVEEELNTLLTSKQVRDKAFRAAMDYCKTMEAAISPNHQSHRAMHVSGMIQKLAENTIVNLNFRYAISTTSGLHIIKKNEFDKSADVTEVEIGGKFLPLTYGSRVHKLADKVNKASKWDIIEKGKRYDSSQRKWIDEKDGKYWRETLKSLKRNDKDFLLENIKMFNSNVSAENNIDLEDLSKIEEKSSKDFTPEDLKRSSVKPNDDEVQMTVMADGELQAGSIDFDSKWRFEPSQYISRQMNQLEKLKQSIIQEVSRLPGPSKTRKLIDSVYTDLQTLKKLKNGKKRDEIKNKLKNSAKVLNETCNQFKRLEDYVGEKNGETPRDRIIGQLTKMKEYMTIGQKLSFAMFQIGPQHTMNRGKKALEPFEQAKLALAHFQKESEYEDGSMSQESIDLRAELENEGIISPGGYFA